MKFAGNNFNIQKNSSNKLSTNEIKGNSYVFNFNPMNHIDYHLM